MTMPFYVSPEQLMADKAEFARKGIARGKSIVSLEYETGILLMAENATKLNKIGEIYDRIAFAGVGKFSEFDQLRKLGVRYADTKGYAYSRDDIVGHALANAYSQAVGEVFTREPKPLEVEVIVAEIGDDRFEGHGSNAIYRIKFDGFISDHRGFCVIGGEVEDIETILRDAYEDGMPFEDAVRLAHRALARAPNGGSELGAESIELCVLERSRKGRKFRRFTPEELSATLGE